MPNISPFSLEDRYDTQSTGKPSWQAVSAPTNICQLQLNGAPCSPTRRGDDGGLRGGIDAVALLIALAAVGTPKHAVDVSAVGPLRVDVCHEPWCYVSCYVDPRVTSNAAPELRFLSGAKGIRTPDPHTASVVRYQLRHSPLHRAGRRYTNQSSRFKTAPQGTSPPTSGPSGRAGVCSVLVRGRVSGANAQPTAATARITPLITKADP